MSQSNTVSTSGGIGLGTALTVAFVVLKLLGKITWSWWWVLAPTWIPVALFVGVLIVFFLFGLLAAVLGK